MKTYPRIFLIIGTLVLLSLACSLTTPFSALINQVRTSIPQSTELPQNDQLENPVKIGSENPDEPIYISGTIPFTSPFFLDGAAEPFVLLEDEAGFVARNLEFNFPLKGQAIGPIDQIDENTLSFSLSLPSVPQGTLVDVDNNGQKDQGIMVFTIAYWSNTWGGPFLEPRDGKGWSTAYASTTTDPDRDNEINGGHLIIWAPDENQGFPSGYGNDQMLFTADDPIQNIPAGYSLVDLDVSPFRIYKEAQPVLELIEGDTAVNDFSDMSYTDAFDAMFNKVSVEYPFTKEKNIDWNALYSEYSVKAANVRNDNDFYRILRDFTYQIPDGHVSVSFNADVFYQEAGGSYGMVLAELSDGSVIVKQVIPGTPADLQGIIAGTQIITWNGQEVREALDDVVPYLGPYSSTQARREGQLIFLTRNAPGTSIEISYQNPGQSPTSAVMISDIEYDSLFAALPYLNQDELALPIEAEIENNSGLGYIRINSFSDDYNLMARLWERAIQGLMDNNIPGVIIDIRVNGGGNMGLALDFAGYFFDQEVPLSQNAYYNDSKGDFEFTDYPSRIVPAPEIYEGAVALLISPDCVSACEGFANAMSQNDRSIIVGNFATAGAFGEVGRGQYSMPADLSMQFPTGRPETMDGKILIEGIGVQPDITVPITSNSVLGARDTVLDSAINALLQKIN